MQNLLVTCPKTGKLADTGFTMDRAAFETAPLEGNAFECGHCGDYHAWTKVDIRWD